MVRLLSDPRCLEHVAPVGYPERPERLVGTLDYLASRGWEPRPADLEEVPEETLRAIHDAAYLRRFRGAVGRGEGVLDSADNPLSPATWTAASAAAATGLGAAEAMLAGAPAFALIRPPGHHAERATAMGFCYFNNIALAAEHLIRQHGLERLAILDFDVHHGNGTQHIFEERGDVFFVSLHQFPFYPGTGAAGEVGRGAGEGATLNIPLAAGADDALYRRAMRDQVLPAVRAFGPQALLVSAGFDAWRGDPLGGMRVSMRGYWEWGSLLAELAQEVCEGRVCSLLEGGYDLRSMPRLLEAYLSGLEGRPEPAAPTA